MTEEKIIEIAYQFADGECELMFSEVALINFVQSIIEKVQAEKSNSNNQETMSIDGSLSKIGTKSDIKFNSNGQELMSIDGHLRPLATESPTTKLRWFNPFPYDRCKFQQEWVNQYGETEWRDVPTEE